MLWYPGGLFQTYCTVDIAYYPFDTQLCSFDIITWSEPVQFLNGSFAEPVYDLLDILENHPAWDLVGTDSEYVLRPTGYWVLMFKIVIKRKTLFYIINIILPMTLLSSLNSLVFILPAQSGEKMTVSVTSFLSLAVFVSFINEALPQNSDSLCFFSVYVMVQMFLSLCSTAVCALTVSLVHKEQGEASVTPTDSHTSSCVLSSPQSSKFESALSFITSSLSSQLQFPPTDQTSLNFKARHPAPDGRGSSLYTVQHNVRSTVDDLVSVGAPLSPPCASCHKSYQREGVSSGRNSVFSSVASPPGAASQVKCSTPAVDTSRSSSCVGSTKEGSVGLEQEGNSHECSNTQSRFLRRLVFRVDKVFMVTMLCANLLSCLIYTLSMTWTTQHF